MYVILCLLSSFCDGHLSNLGDPGLRLAGWKGSVVALPPLFEELQELENLPPWGGDRTLAPVAYHFNLDSAAVSGHELAGQ